MKTMLFVLTIMSLVSFTITDQLTGRWESKPSEKEMFKTDNSFEAYINKKPFVSGQYTFQDSIFSFVDNGCDGKRGVYKIVFSVAQIRSGLNPSVIVVTREEGA